MRGLVAGSAALQPTPISRTHTHPPAAPRPPVVLRLDGIHAYPRQYAQLLQPLTQEAHGQLVEPAQGDAWPQGL